MEEFDLKRFAKLAMAKKVFIIIIMIISIVAGLFYSFVFVTPKYKSRTTLLLAQINEEKINENTVKQSDITDLSMTSTLLEPYISIIESDKVLEKVISNLNVNMDVSRLKKMLSVTEENKAMLAITVVSENAEFAAKVANEIANVFTEESREIFSITNVNIIDVAKVQENPYNVNHVKDVVIFALLGVFASCGLILLIYMLDTTIKEEEDIEQELKLPVLGVIPTYTKSYEETEETEDDEDGSGKHTSDSKKSKKNNGAKKTRKRRKNSELVILGNTKSPVSEAFRALRTNLTFSPNTRTILVTSSGMSDGKSYVTSNLATALAKAGKKVIIVDADMRKGRQNKIFEVDNKKGLSNYLANCSETRVDIEEITSYIKTTSIPNLHIMTSGSRPSNPSELLIPVKIQGLLSVLEEIYDIVLLDGTPSSIIADSIAIAKFVDYTLLVTSHKTTKIEEAKRVIKSFEQVGGDIKGAVLNKYPLTKEEYSSSYYYHDEKNTAKLEETTGGEIKTVKALVEEANLKNINFGIRPSRRKYEELQEVETHLATAENHPAPNNPILEYKIEKINDEIITMKGVLMQIAMNSNQITPKDIEIIRYDIKNLKDTLDEVKDSSSRMDDLKKEVETTKELAENLVKTQQDNNEKVRKFIENYYKNKSKKEKEVEEKRLSELEKQLEEKEAIIESQKEEKKKKEKAEEEAKEDAEKADKKEKDKAKEEKEDKKKEKPKKELKLNIKIGKKDKSK